MNGAPTVSAIMPVYNGRGYMAESLPPLIDLVASGRLLEVIVVDDGSTDGSGGWAAERGARVLQSAGRVGPGAARNQAAREARGDVVLFVDADVVVHPDVVDHLSAAFGSEDVVAVFGSYDDAPPHPSFASQYMNLRHHHVHHEAAGEASTFWAGCGAVRREAFLACGGYDAQRFDRPSVEDIELGLRLRQAGGRIRLVPEMQGTHLKQWTTWGVIHTDVTCRAIPWSRMLMSDPGAELDLNAGGAEQGKAILAGLFVLSLPLALLGGAWPLVGATLFLAAILANRGLFSLFRRRRGWLFAAGALAFHQLYYLYSGLVFVACWLEHRLGRAPEPKVRGGAG
ncbi:MAG: glycosyl transferase [Deltaproteobacteria bacterium]|jgi:GT2 family glycosyltransferase|nr:glycosyl transferase [Deltaproteobacteria bacterium]